MHDVKGGEVCESLHPIVFLVGRYHLVLHHLFFCEMFAGIHLKHEEKYFDSVADQDSSGLAQFLMFVEVASEGDDVSRWCPWSHEILLGLSLLSREYLAPFRFVVVQA